MSVREGNIKCNCCIQSSLERQTKQKLIDESIDFEEQKTFDWLKYKNLLRLDFYLPEYNVAIECQGIQHFEPIEFFGGIESFNNQVKRDAIKRSLCEEHGIEIIFINSYDEINNIINVINNGKVN